MKNPSNVPNKFIVSYGTINPYRFDKRIFRLAVLLLFLLLVVAFFDQGIKNNIYINCPDNEPYCFNPYYGISPCPYDYLCDYETIIGGVSFGTPPSMFANYYIGLSLLIIIFSFIMNHLFHNMRRIK